MSVTTFNILFVFREKYREMESGREIKDKRVRQMESKSGMCEGGRGGGRGAYRESER